MNRKTKKKAKKDEYLFKEGDLVGAKVKGYPLWPGRIEKVDVVNNRRKYTVKFFNSMQTSQSFVQIKLFKDFTAQEKSSTKKPIQLALAECQKEYESRATKKKKVPSTKSAPPTSIVESDEKGEEEEDTEKKDDSERIEAQATNSPLSMCVDEQATTANSPDPQNDTTQLKSLGPEEGNETIAKLKKKVEEKEKEKNNRKQKMKATKFSEKAVTRLTKINKYLLDISNALKKLSNKRPNVQTYSTEWYPVQRYQKVFEALSLCFKKCNRDDANLNSEYLKCHKTLIEIIENLNNMKKNNTTPKNIVTEVDKCLKSLKSQTLVKKFINSKFETWKNERIERKENDSK